MKIYNFKFPQNVVKIQIQAVKLQIEKAVLTFLFIRTRILSILAQIAHEELFKIMIFCFKLSITTTLTNDNKFPTFL